MPSETLEPCGLCGQPRTFELYEKVPTCGHCDRICHFSPILCDFCSGRPRRV